MAARRRVLLRGVQLAGIAALLALGISLPGVGRLTTEISAKATCQCRYIDGGSEAFCMKDDLVDFLPLDYAYASQGQSVTSSLFGVVSSTGRFVVGRGCAVE